MTRTQPIASIVKRIKEATPEHPIAVFRNEAGLDCFFADTVITRELIDNGEGFIGLFDNTISIKEVYRRLGSPNAGRKWASESQQELQLC